MRWACAALIASGAIGAAAASPGGEDPPAPGVAAGGRVPEHTILVKGAWPSASDSATPLPEDGRWSGGSYRNDYFGLTLRFTARWQAGLEGPPPSDSGAYTLAQIVPAERFRAAKAGHLLITAQDIFFTATQANSPLELVNFTSEHLDRSLYRVEQAPRPTLLGQRPFVRFEYRSVAAAMHWTILATEIRCHIVEFVFVSARPQSVADLLQSLDSVARPATAPGHEGTGATAAPPCLKDYASADHILERVEPVLGEPRFNSIPVRIIIDPQGYVRHIHFLRAFPDQARAITDALRRWRFKPYLLDGKPAEVETGIVFGRRTAPPATALHESVGMRTIESAPVPGWRNW